jgi:hypothetical protein
MSYQKRLCCSLFSLLGGIIATGCGSSSNLTPVNLMVRTVEDTVALQHSPNGVYFNVTAIVRNDDTRPLDVEMCPTPAERDIGGVWTTVFTPNCISSGMTPLSAGDSVVVPLMVGYTTPNTYPPPDPRMLPGRYRVVFGVFLGNPLGPTGTAVGQGKGSIPFIVK